jgi:hypothetical protein
MQQQQKQNIGERIKSHVKEFVASIILMKYIVLLYKNHVISDLAKKSYLKNLLILLDEQTKPGNINDTNPLASIQLSHNLIKFLIKNLNTHYFIENLKFACTAGHSIDVMKLVNIMNSVKLLKPYVNSVLKTINLPDKKTIDAIYEESVTTDGDFNKFLDEIVLFADKIAEVVSKRTLPKPPPQILPQHKPTHQKHGQHKQTHQTHGQHKQTHQTHGQHEPTHQKHGQHKPTHQTHGQHKQTHQTHGQHKQTHQTHGQHKQTHQTHEQHKPTPRHMNNKHHIHEKILAKIKHMLEGLKNMKKHHLQPQKTVSIPTNSEKARKLLGIQTDNKKTTVN